MAQRPARSGVLLVDKAGGMTSHDVVGRVRRIFGQRDVGHTGTLDPMATGLLVLTLGRATRIARFLEAEDKTYVGVVRLGRSTTTYDAEGETTAEVPLDAVARLDEGRIAEAMASLTGSIRQAVPAYSAVKVDGTRLYQRARRGESFETPVREVDVHELVIESVALPDIRIRARVSKGTYIRSLAVQIGDALGLPAHLAALRRTRIGGHDLASARPLEALQGTDEELIRPEDALPGLPKVVLDEARRIDVRHGRPLAIEVLRDRGLPGELEAGAPLRLVALDGQLLAVGLLEHPTSMIDSLPPGTRAVRYACVLAAEGAVP